MLSAGASLYKRKERGLFFLCRDDACGSDIRRRTGPRGKVRRTIPQRLSKKPGLKAFQFFCDQGRDPMFRQIDLGGGNAESFGHLVYGPLFQDVEIEDLELLWV